jgi:heptose-I-phosphate ethanolaminephosphotransferase
LASWKFLKGVSTPALLRLLFEIAFAIGIFLPGFLIGWGGRAIWLYVTVFVCAAAVFFVFAKVAPKFLTVIAAIPIIGLQIANIASWLMYEIGFEYGQLQIILDTEPGELVEFVSIVEFRIVLTLVAILVLYLAGLYILLNPPLFFSGPRKRKIGVALLAVTIVVFSLFHKPSGDIYSFVHIYYLGYKYSDWQREIDQVALVRASIFKNRLKLRNGATSKENVDDIVIVVLGESARRSNFGLYGYHRDTTPNLNGMRDELLVFNNAIAPGNSTVLALKFALTPATVGNENDFKKTLSLVSEARLAGYHTTWISNINQFGRHGSALTMISKEADVAISARREGRIDKFFPKDDVVLPYIDRLLEKQNPDKKQYIFISTMGSHAAYRHRAPSNFVKFKPVIEGSGSYHPSKREKIVNAYDNSILFTDWFLSQLITKLKSTGRSATLVYFSDHGERLYDDGKTVVHGFAHPVKLEYDFPFLCGVANSAAAAIRLVVSSMSRSIRNISSI